MLKRSQWWVLGLGTVLVLLALGLIVLTHAPADQLPPAQTLHVAQAVAHLEDGCLTCHTVTQTSAISGPFPRLRDLAAQSDYEALAYLTTTTTPPHTAPSQVETQLADLGERLLVLPTSDDGRQTAVAVAFLQTYDTLQQAAVGAAPVTDATLWQLARIDALLRDLEGRASPVKWAVATSAPVPPVSLALVSVSGAPVVAAVHRAVWLPDVRGTGRAVYAIQSGELTSEVVYATQRRGPPAGLGSDSRV